MEEKRLFGEIAVHKGYVTLAQVKRALEIQKEMIRSGEGHKLIGVLLVELGFMSPDQVCDVLQTFDEERAAERAACHAAGELSPSEEIDMMPEDTQDPLLPPKT